MRIQVAKRARITDLRGIWPKETDFSDWLVTEDGLALIAEDIGVEVDDPQREHAPGDFSCDIVGHVLGDENHTIVIENQFGKTNHDHLGKLLTYASANSALTAIWLAEHIADDHRKVIDWLNDNTPASISFYLARIQAYRIGDSPVAPQLEVVCRPNLQIKAQKGSGSPELKARHIWRQSLWDEILSYIADKNPPFRVQSASTDAWSNIAVGRSHFALSLTLTPKRQCIGCELWMNPPWKRDAFDQLKAQSEEIEAGIGERLQWMPLPGKKGARILLEAPIDPKDDDNRQKVKEWMYRQSVAFYEAFHDRVKQLRPDNKEPDKQDSDE